MAAPAKTNSIIENSINNEKPQPQGTLNGRNQLASHSGMRMDNNQKPPMVPSSKIKKELDKDEIEAEYLNE